MQRIGKEGNLSRNDLNGDTIAVDTELPSGSKNKFFAAISNRFTQPFNIVHISADGNGWKDVIKAVVPTLLCLIAATTFSVVFYVLVKDEAEEILE